MVFNVALSGINAASEELSVIGNNIANANTSGFKESRAHFADVYAATALGTGSNAVGSGVRLTDVSQSFSQGTVKFTSSSLDLAINGEGFFELSDSGSTLYSRSGSFKRDREGYLVNSSNQNLVGLLAGADGSITGVKGNLKIDASNVLPTKTSKVDISLNLDSRVTPPLSSWVGSPDFGDPSPDPSSFNSTESVTVYDSLGNQHLLEVYFIKSDTPNQWSIRTQIDGVDVDSSPASAPFNQRFNEDGSYSEADSDPILLTYVPLNSQGLENGSRTPQSIVVNFNGSTQFGSSKVLYSLNSDGFSTGELSSLDITDQGLIQGRYTNGQSRALGQVLLANFTNPEGLQPLGNTTWAETFKSGPALTGTPNSASFGAVQSGALEESNVELTEQLVALILAQRNFQANAQTIRTADTVTQSIINLR